VVGPYPTTELGNRYIIHFTDCYSRWPDNFPTPDKCRDTIIRLLMEEIISRYRCLLQILTDNGSEFTSASFEDTIKELNIKHIKTPIYNAKANGLNERQHKQCMT
jgi:transposase InsO family protein